MKKAVKVLLINLAVAFGLAFLGFIAGHGYNANDFVIALGLICLAGAILDLLLSVVLFITGPAQYEVAKGFLLSAGVLFLVGFAACSGATLNFH